MNRISVFVRRQRIKKLETWTIRAIAAEAFLLAIKPELAALAVLVGIVAWFLRLQIDKKFKMRSLPFDLPVTIFVILGAVSVFMSPARNFELVYNYCGIVGVFVLTYLLVGQNIRTIEQVKILAKSLAAAAVVVVGVGLFQYIFGVDISEMKWNDLDAFPETRTRIFSTLENPNVLAGYLNVMICLALGFLAKFGTRTQKFIFLGAILILLACLAMTYSRGAFLAIAAIFVVYGLLYDWRIFTMFALGTAILLYSDITFLERILAVFTGNFDSSSGMRIGVWVSTIAMIADHPFIGIGWGAYKFIYPQYNYYLVDTTQTIYHAHNLYLQTAAEVGITGALAYFWYFFGTMFMALALNSNERYTKMKNTAEEIAKRASESKFKKKFDEELVKTVAGSKFLQEMAQAKSTLILRMDELTHQIFDKVSPPPEKKSKTAKKKSSPELVHHEELTLESKSKKPDDKKSDDDEMDIQKFAAVVELFENKQEVADRNFIAGIKLGVGLAFLAMTLEGISDDLLFNIPSSMLMWMLGALVAAIHEEQL